MSRYADDLKRIVGVDKINKTLKELQNKAAIASKRGEAFYTPTGSLSSSEGNAADSTNPSTKATEQSAAITEAAKEAAASALANNKLSDLAGGIAADIVAGMANNFFRELDGVIDIADLIDAANGNIAKEGLPGFSTLNSQIIGIDGLRDCASSKDLRVRFDGLYIPPPSWFDAHTPPTSSDYTPGSLWRFRGAWVGDGLTVQEAMNNLLIQMLISGYQAYAYSVEYSYIGGVWDWHVSGPPATPNLIGVTTSGQKNVGDSLGGGDVYTYTTGVPTSLQYGQISCTLGGALNPVCSGATPKDSTWPVIPEFQLSLNHNNGFMEPNQYDPNVPANFKNGVSSIDACFGSGRFATIEPASQGGHMVYETNGSGTVTGIITVFNADGTIRAFTDSRSAYKLD